MTSKKETSRLDDNLISIKVYISIEYDERTALFGGQFFCCYFSLPGLQFHLHVKIEENAD